MGHKWLCFLTISPMFILNIAVYPFSNTESHKHTYTSSHASLFKSLSVLVCLCDVWLAGYRQFSVVGQLEWTSEAIALFEPSMGGYTGVKFLPVG